MSDKKKKKTFVVEKPGRLQGEVQLQLHTGDGGRLYVGYKNEGKGLLAFGGQMSVVWYAAMADNPYADLYLLKVYDAIQQLRKQLAETLKEYEDNLKNTNPYLQIIPFESKKPVIKTLNFQSPYGYLAAETLAMFDRFVRLLMTSGRVGVLLSNDDESIKNSLIKQIQKLFHLPFKWYESHVVREDIKVGNNLALEAKKIMGHLPDVVLNKTLRSPYAPPITEMPISEQTTKKINTAVSQAVVNVFNQEKSSDQSSERSESEDKK